MYKQGPSLTCTEVPRVLGYGNKLIFKLETNYWPKITNMVSFVKLFYSAHLPGNTY